MSKVLKVALLLLLVVAAASSYALAVEVDAGENADNQTENEKLPQIDDYGETNKCPANQRFKWKCNYCTCGPKGKDAWCTRMGCGGKKIWHLLPIDE